MPEVPVLTKRFQSPAGAPIATVTINNGPLNLFDQAVFDALAHQIADLAAAPPRAVLLQAQGPVTSAGVDVHLFDGLNADQGAGLWRSLFDSIIHPLEALPCPVVFAAHGLTLTAAFEIALACDLIVASPSAKFGLVETVVGLTPSLGGPQRLAERAGSGRARELVMTADLYSAHTMLSWGVVNAIHAFVHSAALSMLFQLSEGPTKAHAATKAIVSATRTGSVGHADGLTPTVSGELFGSADLRGAVRSFLSDGPGKAKFAGN